MSPIRKIILDKMIARREHMQEVVASMKWMTTVNKSLSS